jgi:2-oxoglutarate dehydrogenase E2 component (dihydrolipoamide succinyltransferase)
VSSSPTRSALEEVVMPQMGVSVAEGTIVEWRKRPGDWVAADETVVEISTDKVDVEVPSPVSGRLAEILVEPGVTVEVGAVLARIDTGARPGEAHADEHPDRPPPISPVVRRIADEHGIDVSQVTGSGRNGRVTKKDLLAHLEAGGAGGATVRPLHIESPYREEPEPAAATEGTVPPVASRTEPLSIMRRQIAEHMVRSLREAAHCTTVVEVDMSAIEAARGELSYLPFVARAAVRALRRHPRLNATIDGDAITTHDDVHLGIAVSLGDEGLIVPVVRDAHKLSHEGLAERIADLAQRARSKRLQPDEVRGGTFTITNPGRFGALLATPIINQPQVAILDLEAVVRRPVAVEGDAIAIRPMAHLCMSWDHRALDGALAARFLSTVRKSLEEWDGG